MSETQKSSETRDPIIWDHILNASKDIVDINPRARWTRRLKDSWLESSMRKFDGVYIPHGVALNTRLLLDPKEYLLFPDKLDRSQAGLFGQMTVRLALDIPNPSLNIKRFFDLFGINEKAGIAILDTTSPRYLTVLMSGNQEVERFAYGQLPELLQYETVNESLAPVFDPSIPYPGVDDGMLRLKQLLILATTGKSEY